MIKHRFKRTTLSVLLVLFLFFSHNSDSDAKTISLEKVSGYIQSVAAFTGDFQQETYDSLLDKTTLSSGKVSFHRPGLMRWDYQQPEEILIVIGLDKIWIYDPLLENVTIQNTGAVAKTGSLSFLLKNEKLSRHFVRITPQKKYIDLDDASLAVYLKPKVVESGFVELQLGLDSKHFWIKQFVIIDSQKNYRKITFQKLKFPSNLDKAQFVFQVTEEMEIIDGDGN